MLSIKLIFAAILLFTLLDCVAGAEDPCDGYVALPYRNSASCDNIVCKNKCVDTWKCDFGRCVYDKNLPLKQMWNCVCWGPVKKDRASLLLADIKSGKFSKFAQFRGLPRMGDIGINIRKKT